jgi:hypothetical protein
MPLQETSTKKKHTYSSWDMESVIVVAGNYVLNINKQKKLRGP